MSPLLLTKVNPLFSFSIVSWKSNNLDYSTSKSFSPMCIGSLVVIKVQLIPTIFKRSVIHHAYGPPIVTKFAQDTWSDGPLISTKYVLATWSYNTHNLWHWELQHGVTHSIVTRVVAHLDLQHSQHSGNCNTCNMTGVVSLAARWEL